MKYCFLDLETTGLEHDKDSILEISFITTDENLNELHRMDEVIIPTKTPLTPFVTQLTGITEEEVQKNGKNFADILPDVIEKIGDATIVGHNIDFDIRYLKFFGVPLENNKRMDTHELARILLPGEESFSLEAITTKYGFAHENAHRAMSDVEACVQLWPMLLDKIKALPKEAIPEFDTFFTKSNWAAGELFQELCGTADAATFYEKPAEEVHAKPLPELDTDLAEAINAEHTTFIRAGATGPTARYLTKLAENSGRDSLIVAPELRFFPGVKQLPTPSVIFDAERHLAFEQSRENMSDTETTFWLQCATRHWLGYRGINFFGLYLHQREWWPEVCLTSAETPAFQEILQERCKSPILSCTPAAWGELCDLDIIKSRKLYVFEAELFAEKLLFAPSKSVSLMKWLDKEDTSNAAHFFVAGFVRDELSKLLSRAIGTFPERELLRPGDRFADFAAAAREISPELNELAEWLENPAPNLVRWVNYFPDNGNLMFGTWTPTDWRDMQDKFKAQDAVICLRHHGGDSNAFCRVFLGRQDGYFAVIPELEQHFSLEIPNGLVSSKSPDFNPFCQRKITNFAEERCTPEHWLAASFSSLASLKNIGTEMRETPPANCAVFGEKLAGGDGKLVGNLAKQTQAVLLMQKIQNPGLEDFPFKTFVVQKFPFAPPAPLLDFLKAQWKGTGTFWDVWVVSSVAARLARAAGQFPHIENVVIIDPAENSGWGKNVISQAFPFANK